MAESTEALTEPSQSEESGESSKRHLQLTSNRFQRAEESRVVYEIHPEIGVTFAEVATPSYWVHVNAKLRPGDLIEVSPEDQSYWGVYRVRGIGPAGPTLHAVHYDDYQDAGAVPDTPGFRVEWKGPTYRWSIIREDGSYIEKGCHTKEEASFKLQEHIRRGGV